MDMGIRGRRAIVAGGSVGMGKASAKALALEGVELLVSEAITERVARHKVIINNLLPGMFHTAAIRESFTRAGADNGTSYDAEVGRFAAEWRIPAQRFGDPDDLGAFCAMFCSRCANYTVGQSLVIDGGLINSLF